MEGDHRIGAYDFESATRLAKRIVYRLYPEYKGPDDCQALLQFMEGELTQFLAEKK